MPTKIRTLKFRLLCLSLGDSMMCNNSGERSQLLRFAEQVGFVVASVKLNGKGFKLTRIKARVLHRCPKCGYMMPTKATDKRRSLLSHAPKLLTASN